jgi:serine/threonine-protein kinase HipA
MGASCTVELFANGTWHPVASCHVLRDRDQGWQAPTLSIYEARWILEHLLPRGFGRSELLRRLGLRRRARALRRRLVGGAGRVAEAAPHAGGRRPALSRPHAAGRTCPGTLERSTDPQAEILEYLRRDIANLALGNTGNHARNTAVQRDLDGGVRLAPLLDFAPMFLHPDGIARRMRWAAETDSRPDRVEVLTTIVGMAPSARPAGARVSKRRARPAPPALDRGVFVDGLHATKTPLREIAAHGVDLGLEPEVHARIERRCLALADQLATLS